MPLHDEHMVLEIARFAILAGREDDFVSAYHEARELLAATDGFRSARMTRGVESPSRFVLLVEWESLEAHTENFRESERFVRWRELIGPFFDGAPDVEHWVDV
jgi:heme-degrading monooxygenase HmoA